MNMKRTAFLLIVLVFLTLLGSNDATRVPAIPTFECSSLDWNPPTGSPQQACDIAFRQVGEESNGWKQGHELWFDSHEKEYRDLLAGSVDRPKVAGAKNIHGEPVYRNSLREAGHVGYQLSDTSLGRNGGELIPRFSKKSDQKTTDMGTSQSGLESLAFGTQRLVGLRYTSGLGFDLSEEKLSIRWKDQDICEYVCRDSRIPRPYFSNWKTLAGASVSRHHPPRKDLDSTDHQDLHPGLWLAFGDINGTDFWRNKGRIEHVRFIRPPLVQDNRLEFSVELKYLNAQREEVCSGWNEYCLVADTLADRFVDSTLLLIRTTLSSDTQDLIFGPQHEMGLGFRVATPITVKSGNGRILSSHGGVNERENWGREGQWWDYSGIHAGSRMGIMAIASTVNSRPVWAHARDYGFLAMNPTGPPPGAKDIPPIAFTIAKGEALSMTFGVLMYSSPDPSDKATEEIARSIAKKVAQWMPEYKSQD